MASLSLAFDILARDRASAEFNKVANSADRAAAAGNRVGTAFGKAVGGIASAAKLGAIGAGVAGFAAIGKTLSTGIGELKDYETGLAQLEAGIKSTGGIAGVSAVGLEQLATAIQKSTGQTDDSIVAAEQLLLTFTNVRDAVGKNNDIFTQTTKIAADMAARFGGDASSSAIQLGKALNDPIKGVTALTRVGISFTDGQKKQIESFIRTGDVISAQKVILGELRKEVGGSAEAYGKTLPGQVDKAKRAFEDFSQNVAGALAPMIVKYLPKITEGLQSLGDKAGPVLDRILPPIKRVATAVFDFYRAAYSAEGSHILSGLQAIGEAFQRLFQGISTLINPSRQDVASFGTVVGTAMGQVVEYTGKALAFVVDSVTRTIPVVLRLAGTFADVAAGVIEFVRVILGALPPLLGSMASVADALGFHGTADKLNGAKTAIQNFGKDAQASLQGFADSARASADAFEDAIGRISYAEQKKRQRKNDLESDDPKVAARAREAQAKDDAAAAKKSGTTAGKATTKAYSTSMPKVTSGLSQAILEGQRAAVEAAKAVVDKVAQQFAAAKDKLKSTVQAALSFRLQIAQALTQGSGLTDVFGTGTDLNANGAFGGKGGDFEKIKRFFDQRLAKLRRFVIDLRKLIKLGLDPRLVEQLAQAGPDAGLRLAEGLLAGGKSGIASINADTRTIAKLADSTGKGLSDSKYAAQIAEAKKQTAILQTQLTKANAHLDAIEKSNRTTKAVAKGDTSVHQQRANSFILGTG